MFLCVRSFVIQSVSEESPFSHFWLDSKVTQRSRLRALHTPSRRLQVGKSGNSLRFGQPDFLSPRSLLRRLTARGPRTNSEAFACFPYAALPHSPFEGGLGGCSSAFGLLSFRAKRRISFLFLARFLTAFGMTRGASKLIFIQAFSPPPRRGALSPTLHFRYTLG